MLIVLKRVWNRNSFLTKYCIVFTVVNNRKSHYETLGVSKSANESDIKQAYLYKCKEFHPDKHQGNKEMQKRFVAVNEAYQTLSDSSKRMQYDRSLSNHHYSRQNIQHRSNYHNDYVFYRSQSKPFKHNRYFWYMSIFTFLFIYFTSIYILFKRKQLIKRNKSNYKKF